MVPKHRSKTATKSDRPSAKAFKKSPANVRRSARLQTSPPSNTPVSLAPHLEPFNGHKDLVRTTVHEQSRSLEDDRRPHLTEDAYPLKQLRTSVQSIPNSGLPLTKYNLRKHNEVMDPQAGNSKRLRLRKRLASWTSVSKSSITQETAMTLSRKSRSTAAHYRFTILNNSRIYIHPTPTPDRIRPQIDAVIQREIDSEKKEQLSLVAHRLSNIFAEMLREAAGEDDWIEPLYNILSTMNYVKNISFQRKADWEQDLKPIIQPPDLDISFIVEPQRDAEEVINRPSKWPQGSKSNLAPSLSESVPRNTINDKTAGVMVLPLPSPPHPQRIELSVKTPRPDITIGLRNTAVANSLQLQEVTEVNAKRFLKNLQDTRDPNRGEPILYSTPTRRPLDIRFPFLLVEGKSYATGNPIFDAQNQAAVSGACALKILHDLDDLANKAKPGSYSKDCPMVFSICTEGPYYELWGHYTMMEDSTRSYNMVLLRSCNAVLPDEILRFLSMVCNVMSWGAGEFLENIVKKLEKVAKVMKKTA